MMASDGLPALGWNTLDIANLPAKAFAGHERDLRRRGWAGGFEQRCGLCPHGAVTATRSLCRGCRPSWTLFADAEGRKVVEAFAKWWLLRRYRVRMDRGGRKVGNCHGREHRS